MNRDKQLLEHIQRNIKHIQRLGQLNKQDIQNDDDKQAALLYYLQTLSESINNLSQEIKDRHPQIQWNKIRGFRNRVAHEYLDIDFEIVWQIVQNNIPELATSIETILEEENKQN